MKRVLSTICCIALARCLFAQKGAGMTDQQFVDFAAQTDMVEANLGELADSAASSDQVKSYAHMLVTDHTNDYHNLWDVAHKADLKMPDASARRRTRR